MNRGQLNGFTLNGASADPIVRVRVDGKGYARVSAGGRVLAYAVAHSAPRARLDGKLGRVEARLSADAVARAAIAGALGRVDVHGLLAVTGRAVIQVTLPPVYGRLAVRARASIGLSAHALVRSSAAVTGQARGEAGARVVRRAPVVARPAAAIGADGSVFVRRWIRSPLEGRGQAFVIANGHMEARLAALSQARAVTAAAFHVKARAPVAARGVAFIDVDFAVNKRLPFDEPAPEYRTFYVPAGQHTFVVSE